MRSPLEQFKIEWYLRAYNNFIDLSISTVTIYLLISLMVIEGVKREIGREEVIGGKYKNMSVKIMEEFINQIKKILGKKGIGYIPYVTTLWMIIMINNLIGLIPYSYTVTSQIILTGVLSLSLWVSYTLIGIEEHKKNYIEIIKPSGVPKVLLPLIMVIEIISYFSRIISLSVRLACNMLSSHTMLKIIGGFGVSMYKSNKLLSLIPISFMFVLFFLELGVALIQSAVFIILTCTYLKDSLYLH